MAFRDDRDALRARKEQLEKDFAAAKQELDRHERKDDHDERELARLRREVERLRVAAGEAPPRPRMPPFVWVMLGVGIMSAAGATFFVTARSAPVEPAAVVAPPEVIVPPPPIPSPPPIATPVEAVVRAVPPPSRPARFGAIVTSSVGRPELPVGSGCVVDTQLTDADVTSLRVRCLDVIVYDPSWEVGMAMTMSSSGARRRETAAGDVYLVEYSDVGQRSGPRPQLSFDSQRSTLRVWSEGVSPFDLRFAVDERGLVDEPREVATQAPHARWRLEARVRTSEGRLPFTERACELAFFPEGLGGTFGGRAQLRCGDVIVYGTGTTGYLRTETVIEGAQAYPRANDTGVSSEDNDPSALLDLAGDSLRVADATAAGAWEASFALRPSPACGFEGTWVGSLGQDSVRVTGQRSATRFVGALTGEATVEPRCPHGEAAVVIEGRRFEGRFGPDFASFLAVDADSTPLTLLRVAP